MKKLLPLLSVFLLPACAVETPYKHPEAKNAEQNYSSPYRKVQGAETGTNIDTTYKHPEAKEVGDLMPTSLGEKVSYMDMYSINPRIMEFKESGLIICHDRNGDKIPEYESIRRFCDNGSDVETYAVFDVPHNLLYIDSSLNNRINSIVEDIDSLEDTTLPMIPVKCGQEKPLVASLEDRFEMFGGK